MANPWLFTTIRPAFIENDYSEDLTLQGEGSIAGWTLEAVLYDANGTEVTTPTVTILDAANRTINVAVVGENFTQSADYTLVVMRTDTGERLTVLTGTLEVINPNVNAWGE